ncbi:MAG: hypothetical protein M3404_06600, partial [Actinomycetota bacterium]|nr:hypothetical protein [Actinomycetota bacterium]
YGAGRLMDENRQEIRRAMAPLSSRVEKVRSVRMSQNGDGKATPPTWTSGAPEEPERASAMRRAGQTVAKLAEAGAVAIPGGTAAVTGTKAVAKGARATGKGVAKATVGAPVYAPRAAAATRDWASERADAMRERLDQAREFGREYKDNVAGAGRWAKQRGSRH